ncbi:MAG: heavy metal sensor histidine kinase [Casimicrobiaceae bacterium]
MKRQSLTLRLTLSFSSLAVLSLAAIGVVLYRSLDSHFLHEDAMELRGKSELVQHLASRLGTQDAEDSLDRRLGDALTGHDTLSVRIERADGAVLFSTSAASFPFDLLGRREYDARVMEGIRMWSDTIDGHRYRITRFAVPADGPTSGRLGATLAMNVDHHAHFMSRVGSTIVLSVAVAGIASGLLGWIAVKMGLTPIRALAGLTSGISANQLHARVDVKTLPRELVGLGDSFNGMLARLEDSFRRLSDFSSDLAHELRTPVSALMTQSQVALSQSRSIDDYREVLYSATEEYERLARMITDMLFLAKADHGLLIPTREPVSLAAEVATLFDFYDALAETEGVTLAVSGTGVVTGDRIMLRRAFSNLLSNALRHTPSGGIVAVAIAEQEKQVTLTISNPGMPIAPQHLPRIFDRFYRVDSARERATDGAGLGLAITKSIIEAHGGRISVRSGPERTRFELTFRR